MNFTNTIPSKNGKPPGGIDVFDAVAPAPTDPPLVVDARRLATLLCAGVRTVWKWDREGRLPPSVRIGGAVRWRLDEILSWLRAGAPDRATWLRLRDARSREGESDD
jgi:predicted DNA-binding transcriptional regulator AlpA